MWTYVQRTGSLYWNGKKISTGYSGYREGKNNPDMQTVENVGPLPCGLFELKTPYDSARVGPYAIPIEPKDGTNVFGRKDFRVHGDSIQQPGGASHGCLIFSLPIRKQIWNSGDHDLQVVAEETQLPWLS